MSAIMVTQDVKDMRCTSFEYWWVTCPPKMSVIQMRSLLTSDEGEYVRIKVNVECDTAVCRMARSPSEDAKW